MATKPFGRAAKPAPDLTSIMGREICGLNARVRSTYTEIRHLDSNIGLLGFQITQYGVRYEVRYKNEEGIDKLSFSVTVPPNQNYLRQPYYINQKDSMRIAEKAHALMLVQEVMGDTKKWIQKPLYNLQKACFDENSGSVEQGNVGARNFPRGDKVIGHVGITFPDDAKYERELDIDITAFEWVKGRNYYLIDCSQTPPQFIVSKAENPNKNRMNMSLSGARAAFMHAESNTRSNNPYIHRLAERTHTWESLNHFANQCPAYETSAP